MKRSLEVIGDLHDHSAARHTAHDPTPTQQCLTWSPCTRRTRGHRLHLETNLWTIRSGWTADGIARAAPRWSRRNHGIQIELALRLEASQQVPTALKRSVLLGYTGVGGTTASSEVEDGNTLGLLNEYYIPLPVARAIWSILKRLGVECGQALEPASGIGVFLKTAPETVRFTAVELNPDAARINRLLHPQASVRVMPFEHDHRQTEELEFDLVIGNPPFGPRGMNALEEKPHRKDYPRYFLDAALDRLRDGGLLAFVIPSGLTDATKHHGFRAFLLARARVRALVRLPVSTFGSTGARVATDILVLEKRPWVVGETLADLVWQFDARILASAGLVDAATRDYLRGEFFLAPHQQLLAATSAPDGLAALSGSGRFEAYPEHRLGELVVDRRWGNVVCDGPLGQAALERLAQTPLLDPPKGPVTLGALLSVLERRESFVQLAAECQEGVRELLEAAWARAKSEGHPHADGTIRADGETFKITKHDGRWIRAWHAPAPLHPTLQTALEVADALSEFHRARSLKIDPSTLEQQRAVALERLQQFVSEHDNPHASLRVTTMARSKPALYRLLGAIRADGAVSPQLLESSLAVIERSADLETTCKALDAARRLTIPSLLHWQGATRNEA